MKPKTLITLTIRLFSLLIIGLFLFVFIGPRVFGDPDIRVDTDSPRHEFCLQASERKSLIAGSPAFETAIEKGTVTAGMIGNEREAYLAQTNKFYAECLADFSTLPKRCLDQFNTEYYAKGLDPERYADFRDGRIKDCVKKGEIEAECKNLYSSDEFIACVRQKQ